MKEIPRYLTEIPIKKELYKDDIFFQEGVEDINDILKEKDIEQYLVKRCSIIIKPEAFATGKAFEIINFLINHNFLPVSYKSFKFNRNIIRDLWRFQLANATKERLQILDMWGNMSDVLFIVLKYEGILEGISASTKLTYIKGHSNPIHHKKGELRNYLGQNIIMLNYIHSSDETADFIRDLGVCFDLEDRRQIINSMLNDNLNIDCLNNEIIRITNETEKYDISYCEALKDLDRNLNNDGLKVDEVINNTRKYVSDILEEKSIDINDLLKLINQLDIPISVWVKIIIGAKLARLTKEDKGGLIPSIIGYNALQKKE